MLFVITGASLPLEALAIGGLAVFAIVGARVAGKVLGVLAVAPVGGLSLRQSFALGLVLTSMSSLALLMYHDISRHFPRFADELGAAFLGAVIVMEIVGSLAVQYGLALSNETQPETGMLTMPPRGSRRQAPQNAA